MLWYIYSTLDMPVLHPAELNFEAFDSSDQPKISPRRTCISEDSDPTRSGDDQEAFEGRDTVKNEGGVPLTRIFFVAGVAKHLATGLG